jgi:tRNA(Ile)-lysidine synthase
MDKLFARFAAAMAPFAPFEDRPAIAVAFSGGADSTALLLLADRWARARQGHVVALTVDHRLRRESSDEARVVAAFAAARGIEHHTLVWTGDKPTTRIHEQARRARYRLLERACREAGILHLLVGHHAADQRETIAMRRKARSGMAGLAGMSAIVETRDQRLLRPLLSFEPSALRDWLTARDVTWIEDPSNRDQRFERARLRRDGPLAEMLTADAATDRVALERSVLAFLARHATFHGPGRIELAVEDLRRSEDELAAAILSRVLLTIGRGTYAPRRARIAGTLAWLRRGGPGARRSIGHCLLCLEPSVLRIDPEKQKPEHGVDQLQCEGHVTGPMRPHSSDFLNDEQDIMRASRVAGPAVFAVPATLMRYDAACVGAEPGTQPDPFLQPQEQP